MTQKEKKNTSQPIISEQAGKYTSQNNACLNSTLTQPINKTTNQAIVDEHAIKPSLPNSILKIQIVIRSATICKMSYETCSITNVWTIDQQTEKATSQLNACLNWTRIASQPTIDECGQTHKLHLNSTHASTEHVLQVNQQSMNADRHTSGQGNYFSNDSPHATKKDWQLQHVASHSHWNPLARSWHIPFEPHWLVPLSLMFPHCFSPESDWFSSNPPSQAQE